MAHLKKIKYYSWIVLQVSNFLISLTLPIVINNCREFIPKTDHYHCKTFRIDGVKFKLLQDSSKLALGLLQICWQSSIEISLLIMA